MRSILRFLLRRDMRYGWVAPGAAVVVSVLLAFWSVGAFERIEIDDRQNTDFATAIQSPPQPVPIAAAAAKGGAPFADRMRDDLAKAANSVRQARGIPLAFDGTRPKDPLQAEWSDTYVCGMKDWGDHRPVLRKLVTEGYGDCGAIARFAAKAPLLYWSNGLLGWFLTLLCPLLAIVLVLAIPILLLTRRAHAWLYSSSVV